MDRGTCVCGCRRDRHEHYRPGRDCGFCGAVVCPRFRPAEPWWQRTLERLRRH